MTGKFICIYNIIHCLKYICSRKLNFFNEYNNLDIITDFEQAAINTTINNVLTFAIHCTIRINNKCSYLKNA